MQYRGKEKRLGRFTGRRAGWKKAIVRLRAGDTIEIFEGV
jgi:large subunit ribosomal protein L23